MAQWSDTAFEQTFAAHRAPLTRLCNNITGDADAADDLVQETLITAWQRIHALRDEQALAGWLFGIARNLCRRWQRAQGQAARQLAVDEDVATSDDLEIELERDELATLLDRALELLPPETRAVLVHKYVEESPHAEIAQRLGISEGAVAMRLQRGRLAFRRILSTDLREDAADHGLIDPAAREWTTTRMWCPLCGATRLSGSFDPATSQLEIRCPSCVPGRSLSMYQAIIAQPITTVNGFKRELFRGMSECDTFYRSAIRNRRATCCTCGGPMTLRDGHPHAAALPPLTRRGFHFLCAHCGVRESVSLRMYAQMQPAVRKFWRRHPQMHTQTIQDVEIGGTPATITVFQSVKSSASIEVIARRDTYELLDVREYDLSSEPTNA